MRLLMSAAFVALALIVVGTTAHATTQSQAMALCARNPKCTAHRTSNPTFGGAVVFLIDNGLGGHWEIVCHDHPDYCECVFCPRRGPVGIGISRIESLFLPQAAGALPGTAGRAP